MAKEVDLPNSDKVCFKCLSYVATIYPYKTREAIEKYCEKFEKEMLNLFDRCYRKGDPKMMHVRRFLFQSQLSITLSSFSTVPKHYSNSMEGHHVYKYMSINMISLSITSEKSLPLPTPYCESVSCFQVVFSFSLNLLVGNSYQILTRALPRRKVVYLNCFPKSGRQSTQRPRLLKLYFRILL